MTRPRVATRGLLSSRPTISLARKWNSRATSAARSMASLTPATSRRRKSIITTRNRRHTPCKDHEKTADWRRLGGGAVRRPDGPPRWLATPPPRHALPERLQDLRPWHGGAGRRHA